MAQQHHNAAVLHGALLVLPVRLLTRKRKEPEKPKLVRTFACVQVTVVPIFSTKGQKVRGRPHNMSALGRRMFLVYHKKLVTLTKRLN